MSEPVYGSRGLPMLLLTELALWWVAFGGAQNVLLLLLGALHAMILVWLFTVTGYHLRHRQQAAVSPEDYLTPVDPPEVPDDQG